MLDDSRLSSMVELEETLKGYRSSNLLGRWEGQGRRMEAPSPETLPPAFCEICLNRLTSLPFVSSIRIIHQLVHPFLLG